MKIEFPDGALVGDCSLDAVLGTFMAGTVIVDGESTAFQVLFPPCGEDAKPSAIMPGSSFLCQVTENPKERSEASMTAAAKAAVTEMIEFARRFPVGINLEAAEKLLAKPRRKSRSVKSRRRG